ncbi:MAG: aldehyde dehydrogenase family protein, partial [Gordonibacter sp.]
MTTPTFNSIADVEAAAQKMHAHFQSGATLPVEHRRQALVQLKTYLKANEERILTALTTDLGKAPFEG